jgi:small subunit ribosomal protein S9
MMAEQEEKKAKKKPAGKIKENVKVEPKAEKAHEEHAVHEHKAPEAAKHAEKPVEAKAPVHKAAEHKAVEAKPEHNAVDAKAPEHTAAEHKTVEAKAPVHKAAEPKKKRKSAPKKEARKVFTARGKRKESVARATIQAGKGVIRMNSLNINSINNHYIREIIAEPMRYMGPEANTVDISINVRGGGVMGQAQAARTAIANALARYFEGMNLKEKFTLIDRSLIIEDTRRVETKKFRGPKARARFQKSYR